MKQKKKKTEILTIALGYAIRELRAKNDITQEELALIAGIDRSYMGAVERGTYNVTVKNILKIADALGVRPSKLLKVAETYWVATQEQS